MAQSHSIGTAAQDEVHAAYVGHSEITAVGDVPVEVKIERPDAHADDGSGQPINRLAPWATKQHQEQSKPEIHKDAEG
jgi:hypothetical protein